MELDKYSLLNRDPQKKASIAYDNYNKDYIETLIFCPSKEPILPSQLCRHYISPGKEMKITLDLMYRRENLKNWKQIQIASLNLVSEFIQK